MSTMSFFNETMATVAPPTTRYKTVLESNLDQMYMILMGLLIQLMQCGFAFLEAGVVPSVNTTNIVMKNALDACIAGVAYWLVGFAFAFGPGNNFIGWTYFALAYHPDNELAHVFLELVIAATCSTIVSGSVAGRCKMIAYIIYSFVITGFIYPIVTRWVWNPDGWLISGQMYNITGVPEIIGFYDFSGSGAVHLCGGTSALVSAVILGARIGRFDNGHELPPHMKGHNVPYVGYGAMILLIGFMAFNGGSVMSVSKEGDGAAMSLSIVNTMISAGCAGYTSLFVRKIIFPNHKWSVFNTVNGAVCGMVAICASCNCVRPWAALVIGVISGCCFNVTAWLVAKSKIDDPADSVGIHFSGGIWGLIAYAFLKYETGILYAWDRRSGMLLAWQLAGIAAIILWTGGLSIILFGGLKYSGLFRVSPEVEKTGSDLPEHDEAAYQVDITCLSHDLQMKLNYIFENVSVPPKMSYTKDGKEAAYDAELKVMNNLQPTFVSSPDHESNLTLSYNRPQAQVNAGFTEGVERTPL
ncbi:unnamed protein product [Candidula unifasciata]|uniref:Ammonium transporter n=1 Tax=Candidula unifasciata TaxID=100452 RepID=A0A8S3ZCC6_9EUPU|nr:unnamed protein product [Candidula unifasciata]